MLFLQTGGAPRPFLFPRAHGAPRAGPRLRFVPMLAEPPPLQPIINIPRPQCKEASLVSAALAARWAPKENDQDGNDGAVCGCGCGCVRVSVCVCACVIVCVPGCLCACVNKGPMTNE